MAREFGPVNVAIWSDPEWRRLPLVAQHLYLLLWTSPSLTYCGAHDWRPKRIAALAEGYDVELIQAAADCLVARHFIVVDTATDEVLVRSWARFDGLVKKPRMAVSYATAYAAVASETIRKVLVHETAKMQELWPELACWLDKRVVEILSHPSLSAKDLPSPSDPFADGFVPGLRSVYDGFAANGSSGLPLVCDPPAPAPASAPYSVSPQFQEDRGSGDAGKPAKRTARQLPKDWEPNEAHAVLAAELGLDLDDQMASFRDYWLSEGKTKVDWDATARNWLRSTARRAGPKPPPPPDLPNVHDLERPPDGLTNAELAQWTRDQAEKRRRA